MMHNFPRDEASMIDKEGGRWEASKSYWPLPIPLVTVITITLLILIWGKV